MSIFTVGFMSEIMKVAFPASQGLNPVDPNMRANDASPSASAGRNLGVGSAAGQPERPAMQAAQANIPPQKQIPGMTSAFKGSSTQV